MEKGRRTLRDALADSIASQGAGKSRNTVERTYQAV